MCLRRASTLRRRAESFRVVVRFQEVLVSRHTASRLISRTLPTQNKNGFVTSDELKRGLIRLNLTVQPRAVEDLVRLLDRDGDGQLKLKEFQRIDRHVV